jgi:hydroxymethylglutaryl-CoA lyase
MNENTAHESMIAEGARVWPDALIVQEVASRDGLQIEPSWIETDDKIALINRLSGLGFTRIEAGSFVSPKAVPTLRDSDTVFRRIARLPGIVYVALVPNARGAEHTIDAKADELNLVMSASETHSRANMRMSCDLAYSFRGHCAHRAFFTSQ